MYRNFHKKWQTFTKSSRRKKFRTFECNFCSTTSNTQVWHSNVNANTNTERPLTEMTKKPIGTTLFRHNFEVSFECCALNVLETDRQSDFLSWRTSLLINRIRSSSPCSTATCGIPLILKSISGAIFPHPSQDSAQFTFKIQISPSDFNLQTVMFHRTTNGLHSQVYTSLHSDQSLLFHAWSKTCMFEKQDCCLLHTQTWSDDGLNRLYSYSISSSNRLLKGTLVKLRIYRDDHHDVFPFWCTEAFRIQFSCEFCGTSMCYKCSRQSLLSNTWRTNTFALWKGSHSARNNNIFPRNPSYCVLDTFHLVFALHFSWFSSRRGIPLVQMNSVQFFRFPLFSCRKRSTLFPPEWRWMTRVCREWSRQK